MYNAVRGTYARADLLHPRRTHGGPSARLRHRPRGRVALGGPRPADRRNALRGARAPGHGGPRRAGSRGARERAPPALLPPHRRGGDGARRGGRAVALLGRGCPRPALGSAAAAREGCVGMRHSIRDRLLRLCSHSYPRAVRERDGEAIVDLAGELADAGSSPLREAAGLVLGGASVRLRGTIGGLAAAPWQEARARVALPLAAALFALAAVWAGRS